MSVSERDEAQRRVVPGTGSVSMRELLASCAAARAVSTPPRPPAPEAPDATPAAEERRSAA